MQPRKPGALQFLELDKERSEGTGLGSRCFLAMEPCLIITTGAADKRQPRGGSDGKKKPVNVSLGRETGTSPAALAGKQAWCLGE
ncbi:hypothetical protein NDU88_006767 [Pleurodeles waltl]|uniref:Uncharacterized protein n=1 Tax=Pleurodeles waltl TaxID=8319 RepID=A0AAV7WF56_PLEWA|nr:hypothetical protein NDU88_006767 [Pleurodeles waltl]